MPFWGCVPKALNKLILRLLFNIFHAHMIYTIAQWSYININWLVLRLLLHNFVTLWWCRVSRRWCRWGTSRTWTRSASTSTPSSPLTSSSIPPSSMRSRSVTVLGGSLSLRLSHSLSCSRSLSLSLSLTKLISISHYASFSPPFSPTSFLFWKPIKNIYLSNQTEKNRPA